MIVTDFNSSFLDSSFANSHGFVFTSIYLFDLEMKFQMICSASANSQFSILRQNLLLFVCFVSVFFVYIILLPLEFWYVSIKVFIAIDTVLFNKLLKSFTRSLYLLQILLVYIPSDVGICLIK